MNEELEIRQGSGPVFRDHGDPEADSSKLKTQLAAEIIGELNARAWSTRKAGKELGIDQADIVRIRNANLNRFALDRLVRVQRGLNRRVELKVRKVRANATV
jgi:predicted XRE-type DNA-binding protein